MSAEAAPGERRVSGRQRPRPVPRRAQAMAVVLLVAMIGGLAACQDTGRTSPTTIALDAGARYQTIDAWAVYPRYWEHDKANNRFDNSYAQHADAIFRFLVNEVGINGVRIKIWSGLENPEDHWSRFLAGLRTYEEDKTHRYEKINDNDDPWMAAPAGFQFAKFDYRLESMALPLKRAVEANGERLHVNVIYVDFAFRSNQGSLSHARSPEEFAELVLIYFERLREKYGIVPDSFEIVLEPENTEHWRGHEIGRALLAVKARLNARGFNPEFAAPSAASMANSIEYFDQIADVPGAVAALDTIAYHRYGMATTSHVEEIRARADERGLKTAMLEKIDVGVDELFEDLTVGRVSAWQQWAIAGRAEAQDKGAFYLTVDMSDPANPGIRVARQTFHLTQVFRYVRSGAVRIGAVSTNPDKVPVAFINADGKWAVIVRAKQAGGAMAIEKLPAGEYGLRYVGEDNEIEDWPPVQVSDAALLRLQLPGPGTLSIYEN